MKELIILLLVAVICLSFVACDNESGNTETPPSGENTENNGGSTNDTNNQGGENNNQGGENNGSDLEKNRARKCYHIGESFTPDFVPNAFRRRMELYF